jgi:hypothetical protein
VLWSAIPIASGLPMENSRQGVSHRYPITQCLTKIPRKRTEPRYVGTTGGQARINSGVGVVRDELPLLNRAKAVAFEIDLAALTSLVLEVEQDMTNRPPLHRSDERGDTFGVIRGYRCYFGDVEPARFNEFARQLFARKCQRPRPRLIFLLIGNNCPRAIEQEIEFRAPRQVHAASTLSRPSRIASARSRTKAGYV